MTVMIRHPHAAILPPVAA